MDLQTEYKYNTSIEMLEYMLSSHPYHQEPFQINGYEDTCRFWL